MPTEKAKASWPDICAGLILTDRVLFRRHFWSDDFSLPPSPEQKLMWCDTSDRVLYCTGRKIAKTADIEAEVIQHGIIRQGEGVEECLLFTPSDVHLTPIVDRIWERVKRIGLFELLVTEQRRGENTILRFQSGVLWYMRIEGTSGTDRNVIGLRAAKIVGDEQAYGQLKVYNSLLQTALPDATWKLAGVPNGVRQSTLYALDATDQGSRFSRHKYTTFVNPLYYDPEKRANLIKDYGGEQTQDYITQVLGEWGEEMVSSFPPGSFVTDSRIYFAHKRSALRPEDIAGLPSLFKIPSIRCKRFAIGWDYGFSPDPSEIHVAVDVDGDDVWAVYLRLQLRRTPLDVQCDVIRYLISHVALGDFVGLSTDKLDGIHKLQSMDKARAERYLYAKPAGVTQVDVDVIMATEFSVYHSLTDAQKEKKIVNVPNKIFYHGLLKDWLLNAAIPMDGRKLLLGKDGETVNELIATVEKKSVTGHIQYYGPPDPNIKGGMLDHVRESLVYLCDAINRGAQNTDEMHAESDLIAAMGWAGAGSWQPSY